MDVLCYWYSVHDSNWVLFYYLSIKKKLGMASSIQIGTCICWLRLTVILLVYRFASSLFDSGFIVRYLGLFSLDRRLCSLCFEIRNKSETVSFMCFFQLFPETVFSFFIVLVLHSSLFFAWYSTLYWPNLVVRDFYGSFFSFISSLMQRRRDFFVFVPRTCAANFLITHF